MKNLLYVIPILGLLLFASCSKEQHNEILDETLTLEENSEELKLTPKTLATIKIADDVDLIFRSEEDGVLYEAVGDANTFSGLGELKNLSTLELFMALTNNDITIPKDLLLIEENKDTRLKAMQRGTIEKHDTKITSKQPLINQKFEGSYCLGVSGTYNTFNEPGRYRHVYDNYLAGSSGTTFYSSGKPGTSKCKRLELEITNCDSYNTIKIKTYYKLFANGSYKLKKTVNVPPNTCVVYKKTFGAKVYRRTRITSSSGSINSHRFGGFLLYKKYQ